MAVTTTAVRYPGPGCVVEFMHGNKPILAWVLEEQSGRLRLLTINKREVKLATNRLLPWSGPQYGVNLPRADIAEHLARHEASREAVATAADPLDIWELAQGEVSSAGLEWFAELVWGKEQAAQVDNQAGLGRAMLEAKTHFKFHPPDFEIYPRDKVEARLVELDLTRERERLASAGGQFFQELWAVHTHRLQAVSTAPDPELAAKLEALLRRRVAAPEDQDDATLWKIVSKGLPEDPYLPLLLAQAWGVLPRHYNYLMDQAGYDAGDEWSSAYAADIAAVQDAFLDAASAPEPWTLVSIDSETTRDVDDVFAVERTPEGWFVRIGLACPAVGLDLDSPLAAAVAVRATSIYLPEAVSHMLPECLGTDLFSLTQQQARPTLVLECRLDGQGQMLTCAPRFVWIETAANLTYEAVERCFNGVAADNDACTPFLPMLQDTHELAKLLRAGRLSQGAVIIEREEPDIVLHGEGAETRVEFVHKPACPKAQLLVSELMILANSGLAGWAKEHELPLLFRTQNITLPKESNGVWRTSEDIHRVVKILGSSIVESRPRPHASLGVQAYAPISSPLRRYTDFVNLLQTLHFLEHATPRWSAEQLESMLPTLNTRLDAAGRVQRFRPRYWKLLYLKQLGEEFRHKAVIVEDGGYLIAAALPEVQIFVRGPRDLFGEKHYPGQPFSLRLGRIDPLNNDIHILEAVEVEGN